MFPRYNRLVDSSPKSDINRCNVVRSTSEAAGLTPKFVSGRPIGFSHVAARGAGLRGVPRIDKDHRNTCDLRG